MDIVKSMSIVYSLIALVVATNAMLMFGHQKLQMY